jgi:hypothetical protein
LYRGGARSPKDAPAWGADLTKAILEDAELVRASVLDALAAWLAEPGTGPVLEFEACDHHRHSN